MPESPTDLEVTRLNRRRLAIEGLCVLGLAWTYFHLISRSSPYLPGIDGYYHIKLAWLMDTEGWMQQFPWAGFSMWRDNFFDKDFGFHVLLSPFTHGDLAAGAKLAATTFAALFVTSFYLIMRLERLRWPWLWTLILLGCGGIFAWRLNLPRPHLLSMTLSLWATFLAVRRSWKGLAAISFVYALCYTAPHLPVIYAVLALAAGRLCDPHASNCEGSNPKRWDWQLPTAATTGLLAGWLIHPHFPNNFLSFVVQIVNVLGTAWLGIGADAATNAGATVHLGAELAPATTAAFLTSHTALLLLALLCISLVPRITKIDRRLFILAALALLFFVMTCLSKRFVEYWVPQSVWLAAVVISRGLAATATSTATSTATATATATADHRPVWFLATHRRRIIAIVAVCLLVTGHVAATAIASVITYGNTRTPVAQPGAQWLETRAPKGSTIFTCDWDDAPGLFYFNHHNRYLVFLDPTFMTAWSPRTWDRWRQISHGHNPSPADAIVETFGAHFGYCRSSFAMLYRQLQHDPRVQLQMLNNDTYVFAIDTPLRRRHPDFKLQLSTPSTFDPNPNADPDPLSQMRIAQQKAERQFARRARMEKDTHADRHRNQNQDQSRDEVSAWHGDWIDLDYYSPVAHQNVCTVLRGDFPATATDTSTLSIGGDDDIAVWVNGTLVASAIGTRRPIPNQLQIDLSSSIATATNGTISTTGTTGTTGTTNATSAQVDVVVCQRRGLWGVYIDGR